MDSKKTKKFIGSLNQTEESTAPPAGGEPGIQPLSPLSTTLIEEKVGEITTFLMNNLEKCPITYGRSVENNMLTEEKKIERYSSQAYSQRHEKSITISRRCPRAMFFSVYTTPRSSPQLFCSPEIAVLVDAH